MKQLDTGDARIAYTDEGEGDAIVLLHGAFSPDWFLPSGRKLVEDGYRVLRVDRAGYGRSQDLTVGGLSVAAHADHVARVLEAAGLEHAHVAGQSAGGSVALELAHTRPDVVRTLVLMEPAFPYAPDEPKNPSMPRAIEAARDGDYERGFDLFLGGVGGPGFRDVIARELGEDGLRAAVASSRYFFTAEAPAFAAWTFDAEDAAKVTAPVLLVVGGEGDRLGTPHRARSAHLAGWLPDAGTRVLPGVTHLMPLEDPVAVAATIAGFAAAHRS